jgi:hypothetical protein
MLSCSFCFGFDSRRDHVATSEHDSYLVWRAGLQSLTELHAPIPFDGQPVVRSPAFESSQMLEKGRMRSINRVAIVVRPKAAFFEWAGTLDGPKVESPETWTSVYLVEASEDEKPEKSLQRHFRQVFDEQLESWHTRKADWPSPRTFAMFQEWFDAEIGDLVFDLSERV